MQAKLNFFEYQACCALPCTWRADGQQEVVAQALATTPNVRFVLHAELRTHRRWAGRQVSGEY